MGATSTRSNPNTVRPDSARALRMKAAWLKDADEAVRTSGAGVEKAERKLDVFPPLQVPTCTCPNTIKETTAAWHAGYDPLAKALADAREEKAKAVASRATLADQYQPLAPEAAVWVITGSIDAAIALGIAILSGITRKDVGVPGPARKKKRPAAKATAPRGRRDWRPRVVS